jgi:hypothetical protein
MKDASRLSCISQKAAKGRYTKVRSRYNELGWFMSSENSHHELSATTLVVKLNGLRQIFVYLSVPGPRALESGAERYTKICRRRNEKVQTECRSRQAKDYTLACFSTKNMRISPLLCTAKRPRSVRSKCDLSNWAVASETFTRPGWPNSSMRAAVLTVSPQIS